MHKLYFREYLGEVIRNARHNKGLTLSEVSARGYLSIPHLSELERGLTNASFDVLEGVARGLDVPLSEILREVSDLVEYHEVPRNKQTATV